MPLLPDDDSTAVVMAGIPATNRSLYHAIRFSVGDPAGLVVTRRGGAAQRLLIVRDIEMDRARRYAAADRVACPKDFEPPAGLSGDRETATAQAVAQAVVRSGCKRVVADRSLPLIFADQMIRAGIEVVCDGELGVIDRRAKDEQEVAWLAEAQAMTEAVMEHACRLVAHATADQQGVLQHDGAALTAERVRYAIDTYLLRRGYTNPRSIVAAGGQGADCHNLGEGPIHTGQPVIIDIFPQNRETKYNGDCTRTVVHGQVPDEIAKMHAAVVQAKQAATLTVRPGVTGEDVHRATMTVLQQNGYAMGFQSDEHPTTMPHGTGHGIGLDVHEPPLLDIKGPELVVGDALTIEPGLYKKSLGGVRIEDMVIVTPEGCVNFNKLPEGLDWK